MDFRKDNVMESVKMETENKEQKIERIVLDTANVTAVLKLSDQIILELGDLVQVTQKAVANFIIRKRSQALSSQEMSEFLSENYDLVKALKHATQKAIKAKHNGDHIEISDVLKLIQTPSVKSESASHKVRGRKKKVITTPSSNGQNKEPNGQLSSFGEVTNGSAETAKSDSISQKNSLTTSSKSP